MQFTDTSLAVYILSSKKLTEKSLEICTEGKKHSNFLKYLFTSMMHQIFETSF